MYKIGYLFALLIITMIMINRNTVIRSRPSSIYINSEGLFSINGPSTKGIISVNKDAATEKMDVTLSVSFMFFSEKEK